MKILVLGGSYFLGKHFVMEARFEHDITVLNRGNRPLKIDRVTEIVGDRHDENIYKVLNKNAYDVVIDFCGYEKGDIALVFENLKGFSQYIFVSTCDVYKHGTNRVMFEDSEYEDRDIRGENGAYIFGKIALEQELTECAKKYCVAYTSIRPSFIYGPDNYAPREGIYFHWIKNAGQIIQPEDATGEFQMVFVLDVVKVILRAIGNQDAYNQAYNLTPMPMITYESFAKALSRASAVPFEKVMVPVSVVLEKNIPLPFPLYKEESNWYNGDKVLALIGQYTDLVNGLKITMNYDQEKER